MTVLFGKMPYTTKSKRRIFLDGVNVTFCVVPDGERVVPTVEP